MNRTSFSAVARESLQVVMYVRKIEEGDAGDTVDDAAREAGSECEREYGAGR